MKTFQKIGTGAVIIMAALALLPFLKGVAFAAVAQGDIAGASYTFQDRANIVGDFGASGKVTFTDVNPFSLPRNYAPIEGGFCPPSGSGNQYGITISSSASLTTPTITGQLWVGYLVGDNCISVKQNISIANPQTPVPVAAATFEWDGQNITTFPGETDKTLTFSSVSNPKNAPLYFSNQPTGNCPQNGAIILTNGTNQGTYYTFSGITFSTRTGYQPSQNLSDYPLLNNTGAVKATECHVDSASNITISGTQGQQAVGGPNTTVTNGSADSSCEASSGTALAWLMCPLFSAVSAIVQGTINAFESILSFTVAQDLGNSSCQINNQGCQASVRLTWSIIKNVASVVLVIIMLIMIISQAIGGGPFDAYTIRKLLPKLVAAVILMQLSWPLVAWVIDIFNDIGKGLQDLLYAPFGGSNSLNDLGVLIHHAGLSDAGTAAFNWVAILGAGAVTLAALPTALFLAFSAIVGLFVGLITLIFRKILIIMLLILSPLAIIAWVLPGTQRYWKLWSDNLLKALAMFPLIVAMIAAGRIFAYVAGPEAAGYGLAGGFAAKFLALLFVLVGFIGPLFILPRTYKWGGSMMSAAGGAISNAGARLNKGAEEPIKGWTKRQVQGRYAKKYVPKGAPGSNIFNRTANSLLGGRIIPTKYRAAILTQTGDKWNEERDAEAQALMKRKGETAMKEGYEAAVLTDDKTGFARWREDAQGNRLDASGNILYHKQANGTFKDAAGNDVDKMGDEVKERVDKYDEASKRTLRGVAAMKQMWVDLADQSENSHERKMAIRQLTATSSWPEIQGSLSRAGNKVIDTKAWADTITTSSDDYPRVLRSRVDATPHIDNWAQRQLEEEKIKNPARVWTPQEEKDFISQKRILYSIRDQMSNEDFQTQSEGYWEEVARVANLRDSSGNLTQDAKNIQEVLRQRFTAIHDIGGTAPQQLLGHLAGGSIQGHVDRALGPGANVREYLEANVPLGSQTSMDAVTNRWQTTIPSAIDLGDPATRIQYKNSLLTTINTSSGQRLGPVAQTLAQGLAYNVVPPGSPAHAEYMNVLHELRNSAAASPEAKNAYNALVDTIHNAYDRRALEAVQAAVTEGRPAADVAAIKAAEDAAAAADKAQFVKIP